MKKLSTLLFILVATSTLFAQEIPNNSFENWSDDHTAVSWNSSFNTSFPVAMEGFNFTVVIDYNAANKSTFAHSGSHACQLVSQPAYAQMAGINMYTIHLPGMIQLGHFDVSALQNMDMEDAAGGDMDFLQYINGGIAFNQIPTKMTAWIAFSSGDLSAPDTMNAVALLTRWNNGEREIVAQGEFSTSEESNEYIPIEVPITVKEGMEGATPDTLNIIFSSAQSQANEFTVLHVDDVALEMCGSSLFNLDAFPLFSVRPNPATDVITLLPANIAPYEARLFDANGRLVWSGSELDGETNITTSALTPGIYFVQIRQDNQVKTQKVVVK